MKMLAKRIIPCLDVDRGRVVKGVRFVDIVDAGDPIAFDNDVDRSPGRGATAIDQDPAADDQAVKRSLAFVGSAIRRASNAVFFLRRCGTADQQ